MIDFYEIPPSPPCRSVKMLAKLLNIELNVHIVDLFNKKHLEPEYLKINPFHKVPAIDDDGFTLSESKAIMVYFVNKYAPDSGLYPKDPQKRAVVDQMLHTDNSTIFPAFAGMLRPQIFQGLQPPPEAVDKAKDILNILNNVLSKRDFAAGSEITLADLSMGPSLQGFQLAGLDLKDYPNVQRYLDRLRAKLNPMYDEVNEGPLNTLKEKLQEKMGKK